MFMRAKMRPQELNGSEHGISTGRQKSTRRANHPFQAASLPPPIGLGNHPFFLREDHPPQSYVLSRAQAGRPSFAFNFHHTTLPLASSLLQHRTHFIQLAASSLAAALQAASAVILRSGLNCCMICEKDGRCRGSLHHHHHHHVQVTN